MEADEIIRALKLERHLVEGGFFKETFRSPLFIAGENLPPGYEGNRSLATAIFYLLTPGTFSEMHRLPGDEIFHFYLGGPVEMLHLFPDGTGKRVIMGNNILEGMMPQIVVPGGVWQGSRLLAGGKFALLGTTMSPGFDYADYQAGKRTALIEQYPQYKDMIILLTREHRP